MSNMLVPSVFAAGCLVGFLLDGIGVSFSGLAAFRFRVWRRFAFAFAPWALAAVRSARARGLAG